jgi:hypothetical protein
MKVRILPRVPAHFRFWILDFGFEARGDLGELQSEIQNQRGANADATTW